MAAGVKEGFYGFQVGRFELFAEPVVRGILLPSGVSPQT